MSDDAFAPLLIYGIVRADAFAPNDVSDLGPGVGGRSLSIVKRSGLAAIVSSLAEDDSRPPAPIDPETAEALAHRSVVEAAFERATIIPVRFGTTLEGDAALNQHLQSAAARYRDTLKKLDGRAEIGIRLALREDEPTATAPRDTAYRTDRPGTAYLLAQQQQQNQRRRRAVRTYRRALSDRCDRTVTTSRPAGSDSVSMAFLVPRSSMDRFREAAARVRAPEVQSIDVVGPWAPYSFV